ncbi:hypothetical protein ACFFV7_03050 [Nonomuraea spiralis]|uniref:Uncharacterized protein n=1 Tax=Nonomuraea spiralis TaxID=46182 RepID=A0ABV5I6K0_9ACTN|nr:hypothetical protein [Nonomuraea spiralis]GGS66306.1 hypothetical protein GCM10010176_006120 [Nonomuraea spiralis]
MNLTIAVFWPPPPHETTGARYRQIAEAGIDLVITGNYLADRVILRHTLALAEEAGLGVLVASDPRVDVLMRDLDVDPAPLLAQVVDDYRTFRSFRGVSLMDEPEAGQFARVAEGVAAVRAAGAFAYSNLLPSHATGPYDAYVGEFARLVRPDVLSFDRYPFLADGFDEGYFGDLATVREHARRAGLPAWMHVQTLAYDGHREPSAAELAWQVNTALAYGYTGIQYFTYWTPDPARGEGFHPALIDGDGVPTERYGIVRDLNLGWLRPVAAELTEWTSVEHTGDVLVGHYGERQRFVCNARFDRPVEVTIDGITESFDPASGSYQACGPVLTLAPGAARLVR